MKLQKLCCPNCEGVLDINITDQKQIFCPYCGQKFLVDDGRKEYTINKNININKNVTHVTRKYDEAEVIKAKSKEKENKYLLFSLVLIIALLVGIEAFCIWMADADDRAAKKAKENGLISAGSYSDYDGENYEAVIEQLEALGFENITTIDLEDAGIAIWKKDKVDSVSIGGDTTFGTNDYFKPDMKIIVKYH